MERIKLTLPEKFDYAAIIPIRITDVNYGGHVGNDKFLTLIHEARQQYLLHHGLAELQFEGAELIMTDAAVEYKKELSYGDTLRISVAAAAFEKFTFDIFYKLEIVNGSETILAAKAKTGMACYNYATKKLARVPERAKEKLAQALPIK